MTQVPLLRQILGWLTEGVWFCILLASTPFLFWWKKRSWEGHRKENILILCDAFTSPLLYLRMGRYFARQGFPVSIFATGSIFRRLAEHSIKLSNFLEEEDSRNIIIIGHGLGGLVPLSLPDAPRRRIIHLAPLASPINGTRLLLPFTRIPALRDMAVGSEFLLYNRTNAMLYADFTPFTNWQDEFIVPFELSRYGQGRDLILDRVGHWNLVWDKANIQTIIEIVSELHPDPNAMLETGKVFSKRPAGSTKTPPPRAKTKNRGGVKKTKAKTKISKKTRKKRPRQALQRSASAKKTYRKKKKQNI